MPTPQQKQAALAEARKRGLLSAEKAAAYDEAQRRGLLGDSQGPKVSGFEKAALATPLAPLAVGKMLGDFAGNYVAGKGDTREQAHSRIKSAPAMARHGMDLGMSDEVAGVRAQRGETAMGRVVNAVEGVTDYTPIGSAQRFGAGFAGLALEAIGKQGERYTEAADTKNANINEIRAEHPVTAFGAEMAGGAALPGGQIQTTAQGAKGLAQAAYQASKVGAAYGGAYMYADTQGSTEDRFKGGAQGALAGGFLGGLLGAGGKTLTDSLNAPASAPKAQSIILEMAGEQVGRSKGAKALTALLKNSGFSSEDVRLGMVNIRNRLKFASDGGERVPILATELQKEFPAAANNIREVFQQLATAPPTQGNTARPLIGALDDQFDSQLNHFERVSQERLGTSTVNDELAALADERAGIGEVRDRVIKHTATDGRTAGARQRLTAWYDDFSDDREVMGTMRAAAREMGYKGKTEIADAIAENPALLLQKFGEKAGAQIRSPRGASPVLEAARKESEFMFDEMSRYGRQADSLAFAPKDTGKVGPYKRQQAKFAENYSQEEAIAEARGRFAQARDPVKAEEFNRWFKALPEGEQRLARVVIRQDMEKMLRGGNIDDAGAYLTNLKKLGVRDVLEEVLGEDGRAINRAIEQLVGEQTALKALDPRKGLQQRTVRGRAADRARNLYTTNPIARAGDAIPFQAQAADLLLMPTTGIPWMTVAKQGSKMFRPRSGTREELAQLLSMRQGLDSASPPTGNALASMPQTGGAAVAASQNSNALAPRQPMPPMPKPLPQDAAPMPAALAPVHRKAQMAAQDARQRANEAQMRIARAEAEARSQADIQAATVEAAELEAQAVQAEAKAAAAAKITPQVIQDITKKAKAGKKQAQRLGEQEGREAAEQARQRVQALEADRQRLAQAEANARSAQQAQQIAREQARIEQEILEAERQAVRTLREAQETADAPRRAALARADEMKSQGASVAEIAEETGLHHVRVGDQYIETPPSATKESVAEAVKGDPSRWPVWLQELWLAQNPNKTLHNAQTKYDAIQRALSAAREAMEKSQKRKAIKENAMIGAGVIGAAGAVGGVGYAYNEFSKMEAEKAEAERKRQERNAKSRETRARNKARKEAKALAEDSKDVYVFSRSEYSEALARYQATMARVLERDYDVVSDGLLGGQTREALRLYQTRKGLRSTGYFNRDTVEALDSDFQSLKQGAQ